MNIFAKAYLRTFQWIKKLIEPSLKFRDTIVLENQNNIKDILVENNLNHPILLTDENISKLGLYEKLKNDLEANNIIVTIVDNIPHNYTTRDIDTIRQTYSDNHCNCIIAFGGGRVIDCAKVVGVCIGNPNKNIIQMKGIHKVKNPMPLFFAIPTTYGTSSMVNTCTKVFDSNTQNKLRLIDLDLIPNYTILDESLTATLSPEQTATMGMNTLTQAIESYLNRGLTKETEHFALESCRLVFDNILKVYDNISNDRARKNLLKASYNAGLAYRKAYAGYTQSITNTLSEKYNIDNGLASAVTLPYVISNYGKTIYSKLKSLAVYCNIARPYDSPLNASSKLINRIFEINEHMGIPKKFDFVKTEDISTLSKLASTYTLPQCSTPMLYNSKELEKIYFNICS